MTNNSPIRARLLDACRRAAQYETYVYTDFLDLQGVSLYKRLARELTAAPSRLWGGYPQAEHQLVIFGSEEDFGYPPEPPVTLLQIRPAAPRFAEVLTHRDYLGALMGLGIRRDVLGDLLVKDSVCCVFCLDTISGYIKTNLTQVRHTLVSVCGISSLPDDQRPVAEDFHFVAASLRLDAVAAALARESRSAVLARFRRGEVFVNGVEVTDGSKRCAPGDTVVLRHVGRFQIGDVQGETRSGRARIEGKRYI